MCPTPSRLLLQPITIEEDPQLQEQQQQQRIKSSIEAASSSSSSSATCSLDTKPFSSLSFSLNSTQLPSLAEWSQSLSTPFTSEYNININMPSTTSSPSILPPSTTPTPYTANSLSPTSQSSMDSCSSPSSPLPKPAVTTRRHTQVPLSLPLPTSLPSTRSGSLTSSTSSVLPLAQPISPPQSPASSSSRSHSRDRFRHLRSSRLTSTELRRRRHRYKDGIRYHSLKAQLDNLRDITCEFQTECQHEWETRTEEWSIEKKANKKILDRIREQRPDCGRAVLLHSASAMIRHLNNEVATLRSRLASLESSPSSIPQCEPSDADLAAAMDAMIRLAHDQQMLQMGGCMITRYGIDGTIMATNDVACQYGYSQQLVTGTCCTMAPQWEEAVPLPPTVDIASSTAKQLMTTFFPASPTLITPWWHHMLLVPIGIVVPFISRRHTPQGQYEINVFWRQVEQGADGIRSIYSVGWDAKVEFMPIQASNSTSNSTSSSSSTIPISSLPSQVS